jgi:hypothetical protein
MRILACIMISKIPEIPNFLEIVAGFHLSIEPATQAMATIEREPAFSVGNF